MAQLVGEHVVLTVHLDSARRNEGQDPEALLRTYERVLAVEDALSGLDGKDPRDRRSPLRYFVSEAKAGINPNAYTDRVAYPSDSIDEALNAEQLMKSWGIWHELGHMHQQSSWLWESVDEVTVNLYSLAVQRDAGRPTRLADDGTPGVVRKYLATAAGKKDFNGMGGDGFFVRLAMFEQLRLAFGDRFYPELHKLARRSGKAGDPQQYLVLNASRWGLTVTPETRAAVAALALPDPDRDPTTLDITKAS